MARLVVVTHEFDRFAMWRKKWPPRSSNYLLFDVLVELKKLGHSWRATIGPNPLHGDMALLTSIRPWSKKSIWRFGPAIRER